MMSCSQNYKEEQKNLYKPLIDDIDVALKQNDYIETG